jgi:hypothetical protein
MRRGLLTLSIAVLSIALVPVATADPPTRESGPQPDVIVTDQCAFPVLGHIDGNERVATFTNKAGDPVKQIAVFPANRLTVTNMLTGRSLTLVATGPSVARILRDGSGRFHSMGHGVSAPNPVTGEPGIWYSSGQLKLTFDADMNVTSVASTGRLVNLCDELAS